MIFPAMNTHMYSHPLTSKQLDVLVKDLGFTVHGPVPKLLACGDLGARRSFLLTAEGLPHSLCEGNGAMYEWSEIVKLVQVRYCLEGKTVTS